MIRWVIKNPRLFLISTLAQAIVGIGISIVILLLLARYAPPIPLEPCPDLTIEERAETKAMHYFHGIMVSHMDEWGREFFYRNNEKCWIDREGK